MATPLTHTEDHTCMLSSKKLMIVWTLELSTTFDTFHVPSITKHCSADNVIVKRPPHAEQGLHPMNINPFFPSQEHLSGVDPGFQFYFYKCARKCLSHVHFSETTPVVFNGCKSQIHAKVQVVFFSGKGSKSAH